MPLYERVSYSIVQCSTGMYSTCIREPWQHQWNHVTWCFMQCLLRWKGLLFDIYCKLHHIINVGVYRSKTHRENMYSFNVGAICPGPPSWNYPAAVVSRWRTHKKLQRKWECVRLSNGGHNTPVIYIYILTSLASDIAFGQFWTKNVTWHKTFYHFTILIYCDFVPLTSIQYQFVMIKSAALVSPWRKGIKLFIFTSDGPAPSAVSKTSYVTVPVFTGINQWRNMKCLSWPVFSLIRRGKTLLTVIPATQRLFITFSNSCTMNVTNVIAFGHRVKPLWTFQWGYHTACFKLCQRVTFHFQ